MADKKKPNVFEQRRRMTDQMSGWEEPPPPQPKAPSKPTKQAKPKGLRRKEGFFSW